MMLLISLLLQNWPPEAIQEKLIIMGESNAFSLSVCGISISLYAWGMLGTREKSSKVS